MMHAKGAAGVRRKFLYVGLFTAFYIFMSLLLYQGDVSSLWVFGPNDQTFLLMQAVEFFLLLLIINLFNNIDKNEVCLYIKYSFYVFVISILFESMATNALHVPITYFPGYRDVASYREAVAGNYYRPFGLIGNAPMNGSALVVLMWFYLGLSGKKGFDALRIQTLTFVTLVANFSGQALFTYFASILIYFCRFNSRNILIFFTVALSLHVILQYQLLGWKFSYEYFFRMFEYLNISENLKGMSMTEWMFGIMANKPTLDDIANEFYPIFSVQRFGCILSLYFWGMILFQKCSRPLKMGMYAVLIGSLHYATILTIVLQVPLVIVMLNLNKQNNDTPVLPCDDLVVTYQ